MQRTVLFDKCSTINSYYNDLRSEIDQKIQSFIIARNGVIDSWPASFSEDFDICEGGVTVFDYFGEDYKVSGSEQIVRKSKQLVYRNH